MITGLAHRAFRSLQISPPLASKEINPPNPTDTMPPRRNGAVPPQGLDLRLPLRTRFGENSVRLGETLLSFGDRRLTNAGRLWEEQSGRSINNDFRPGVEELGADSYAYTLNNRRVLVRQRNLTTGTVTYTEDGRRYFEDFPSENVYNIPATHWYYDSYGLREDGQETFTKTLYQVLEWARRNGVDTEPLMTQAQADSQAHVVIDAFLRQLPDAATRYPSHADELKGLKILDVGSSQFWTWDRRTAQTPPWTGAPLLLTRRRDLESRPFGTGR